MRLETTVFDVLDGWIERYRRRAEQRYLRLDAVLAEMNDAGGTEMARHGQDRGDNHRGRPEAADHPDDS